MHGEIPDDVLEELVRVQLKTRQLRMFQNYWRQTFTEEEIRHWWKNSGSIGC